MQHPERPFVFRRGGLDHLYLHFMNREAHRFSKKQPADEIILEAFLFLLMFAQGPYYTTASFISEDIRYLDPKFDFLRVLHRSGALEIMSDVGSLSEHVSARQRSYEADRSRYQAYFDERLAARLWSEPTIVAESSATAALRSSLVGLVDNPIAIHRLPLPSVDVEHISNSRKLLDDQLRRFPTMGVTLSLFERNMPSSSSRSASSSIGKLLSYLHLRNYLELSGADIMTGFPGLHDLDSAATSYPFFDFQLLGILASAIGCPRDAQRRLALIEILAAAHRTRLHEEMIQAARVLLSGALYATSDADRRPTRVRLAAANFLQKLRADDHDNPRGNDLEAYLGSITAMTARAADVSRRFKEYLLMTEAIESDRTGNVLLVCATEVEREIALKLADGWAPGASTAAPDFAETTTVHTLGRLGKSRVYLCQVEAGDEGASSLRLALPAVVAQISPDFMILVGICFGLRPDKESIGDIVVSKQVQAYNLQRRTRRPDGTLDVTLRGPKAESSATLLDRSRTARLSWLDSKVIHELYMSGSVLSDDPDFVSDLLNLMPEARAGEMEGHGVYAVCAREKVDWIIVKAICDWGFNKSKEHQELAARNAFAYVFHMIGQGGLFFEK